MSVNFEAWPKIARLNRDIVITEKIDGTNAAINIVPLSDIDHIKHESGEILLFDKDQRNVTARVGAGKETVFLFAQSRNRFITPERDNYGFARWVGENAETLVADLGIGIHFGEWWGSGIQRGYGLKNGDKRFSLFNTHRWAVHSAFFYTPNLEVVPVIHEGTFDQGDIWDAIDALREFGSIASPGFKAEGVVVFHTASRTSYKVTLEGDEVPKGAAAHAQGEEVSA